MSEKMFPLQAPRRDSGVEPHPLKIPWSVAEKAYSAYAGLYGKSQSLERLAERGGFGGCEMDQLYPKWREEVSEITALRTELAEAQRRVAELEAGIQEYRRTRCDVYGPKFYLQDTHPEVRECKAWAKVLALLPPDRITHIPGKEDHDGEMH